MKGIQWNINEDKFSFGKAGANAAWKEEKRTGENQVKNGTIHAGSLKAVETGVAGIKEKAQKKALKKLVDQMVKDLKNDDVVTDLEKRSEASTEDIQVRQQQVKDLEEAKEKLMESYHVTEEDIDRSKMGLVMRSLRTPEKLSAEEKRELDEMPDVQRDVLTFDAMKIIHQKEMENDKEIKKASGKAISDFKVELLKDHPMADAQKEADDIMDEAKQTVLDILREEGTDKIEENIEKNEKIQEKEEEKKKEQEEKTQKSNVQTEQSDIQDSMKDLQNVAKEHEKVQREVKKLMDKEILIDDDLKGINVDELL